MSRRSGRTWQACVSREMRKDDVLGLRLHINPTCPVCARRAARTKRLDWLNRIELRTDPRRWETSRPGEIVVVDARRGRAFTGVAAVPGTLPADTPALLIRAAAPPAACRGDRRAQWARAVRMNARSDTAVLVIVAALHTATQAVHAYAHAAAGVENAVWEQLFIVIVITIMPWVAVVVAWKYGSCSATSSISWPMVRTRTRTWADRMDSCFSIRRPASRWWSLPAPHSGSMSLMRARRRSGRGWHERDRSGEHKRRGTSR